jgi:hypothetical protein
MGTGKPNSPLLGYNTNIRHAGHLFHIQTEDSGRDHPHVITHLFTEGTILATKKTAYTEYLDSDQFEEIIRKLMKDQHKSMFVELRDGVHDEMAEKILGRTLNHENAAACDGSPPPDKTGGFKIQDASSSSADSAAVNAVSPTNRQARQSISIDSSSLARGASIFDAPDPDGTFGETFISDKSLDEVILNYLKEELND